MPWKRVRHIVVLGLIAGARVQNSLEDNLWALSLDTVTSTHAAYFPFPRVLPRIGGSPPVGVVREGDTDQFTNFFIVSILVNHRLRSVGLDLCYRLVEMSLSRAPS